MKEYILSIVPGHVASFFYKISRVFHIFASSAWTVIKICSNTLLPATHGFLGCAVIPLILVSHVIFQDPKKVVVWGGQKVQTVWSVQEHSPAILCDCLWCQVCGLRLYSARLKVKTGNKVGRSTWQIKPFFHTH